MLGEQGHEAGSAAEMRIKNCTNRLLSGHQATLIGVADESFKVH